MRVRSVCGEVAVRPAIAGSISSATTAMISSISRRACRGKQREKTLVLHVAAEQGADPRAGDAEGVAGLLS